MNELLKYGLTIGALVVGGIVGYSISTKQIELLQTEVIKQAQALGAESKKIDDLSSSIEATQVKSKQLATQLQLQLDNFEEQIIKIQKIKDRVESVSAEITGLSGEEAESRIRELKEFLDSSSSEARLISMQNDLKATEDKVSAVLGAIDQKALLGKFSVLSIDHTSGKTGQYFNFSNSSVDDALGHKDWSSKKVTILQVRTGKLSRAVLWRNSNGGSVGDGHGRWDDGTATRNQWKKDDKIVIFDGV